MERFHLIDDAVAVLHGRGVFRQSKVYRRGIYLYAAWGGGFIRLYNRGTSIPNVTCEDIEIPGRDVSYDTFGRAIVVLAQQRVSHELQRLSAPTEGP